MAPRHLSAALLFCAGIPHLKLKLLQDLLDAASDVLDTVSDGAFAEAKVLGRIRAGWTGLPCC